MYHIYIWIAVDSIEWGAQIRESKHEFTWVFVGVFYPFDVTVDCNAGTGGPIKRIPCTNLHLLMQEKQL